MINNHPCNICNANDSQLDSDATQSAISAGGSAASTASREAATATTGSGSSGASASGSGTSSGDSGAIQTAAPFMLGAAGLAFAALL